MQDPSELALSAIVFSVKRAEAVVRGAARLGFSVTRAVVGPVLRAVATDSQPPADATDYEPPPVPSPQPSPVSSPQASPAGSPQPSPARDPERERRIALRDQPSGDEQQSPHHMLSNPVTDDPDPTEWPDPYDPREDPRDPESYEPVAPGEAPHPPTGSQSTSAPHPSQDPEAERWNGPKRRTQANGRS